ncbi:MAG TPA: SDR family NAD(P)-dependent oxidoreductase, partial [Opitutaceae bacterium]|nr:SDR family NAD(P)-dependent oxidoreductase [Opitutaceae bacterium]
AFLKEGIQVWGTARDPARLSAWAGRPGFRSVVMDLASERSVTDAFSQAADSAGGRFDVVINNAGYGYFSPFLETSFETWGHQVSAMLTQTLRLSYLALERMRIQANAPGALVNVSSLAVEFPLPYMSGYNVVKAGLSAFSESLIFETRGTGVTVIDFRPGDYRTSFNHSMSNPGLLSKAPQLTPVWRTLEANLAASPGPERAARDLHRALMRGRSGVVRSGSFFQATLAPLLSRLAPTSLRRSVMARYFGAF